MFRPLNRHVLVDKVEEEPSNEEKSLVLLPADYKLKSQFGLYKILHCAEDCEKINSSFINREVVAEESMVQEITIRNHRYYLVLENYIYGVLRG